MDGYITIGTVVDTSDLDKAIKELETKSKRTEKETSIKAKAEIDTTQAEKGLDNLERKADKTSNNVSAKLSKGFMVGMSALNAVAQKVVNLVSSTMNEAISRTDTMNNYAKVMANLGINADEASTSLDRMSDALLGLPTTLDQGALAVQRFTSANGDIKTSTEMFLALNNAILAGGAATNIQSMALEQMSQAYAKGKPDMMEWRSIMTAMPAQLKQISVAMGYASAADLGEALRKGDESMNNFMATIIKLNKEGANGFKSLDEQARNATGGIRTSLTNLKTTMARAMAEIMDTIGQKNIAGFFDTVKNAIIALIPYISAFVKSLIVAVNTVGKVIGTISSAINSLFGSGTTKKANKTKNEIEDAGTSMGNLKTNAIGASGGIDDATASAKKLNKELGNLQGFDEMNILQDNKSTGETAGGTAGGVEIPALENIGNIDTSGIDKVKKKIEELTPAAQVFAAAVWGIGAAFAAWKLGKVLESLGLIEAAFSGKTIAGIGLIIGGIALAIFGIINYLKDPTWQNFLIILGGIAAIAVGIGLIFGAIPALIAAIIGVVIAVALAIYKHWDEVKEALGKVGNWIKENIINPVVDFFTGLWEKIKEIFSPVIEFFGNIFSTIIYNIQTIINNIIQIVSFLWNGIKAILTPIFTWIWNNILKPIIDRITQTINNIKTAFTVLVSAIKTIFTPIVNFFKGIIDSIWKLLKSIGTTVGSVIGSAFKGVVNGVLSAIEGILNAPIRGINSLIDVINKVPGIDLGRLKTFNLPRLAKGGIVNLPGRGVPIGGALAGEVSQEGVIPLTDSQQMQLLGEAIGRYITVNASITNTMNGRVISRELQKINNENDFAFNK